MWCLHLMRRLHQWLPVEKLLSYKKTQSKSADKTALQGSSTYMPMLPVNPDVYSHAPGVLN